MSSNAQRIIYAWLSDLQSQKTQIILDDPNYYTNNVQTLITTSQPLSIGIGTGARILSDIFTTCLTAKHEIIIVTCFWAKSTSQQQLCSLLNKLSSKAIAQGRKIQIRLCFSSTSIWQKLSHTSSLDGKIYSPSSWSSMGLPSPQDLPGVEMVVKSLFIRPFSVMHPKFILVDRKLAFLPSCNVSWEDWFEGCIEMQGEICGKLFDFWEAFWSRGSPNLPTFQDEPEGIDTSDNPTKNSLLAHTTIQSSTPIPTLLLPSPHHQNPRFSPLSSSPSKPPATPLNIFLLHLLASAHTFIFIQTPNLTSKPVISAILSALERGVNISLVISSALMIFEQLGTAGTITEFEVWKLRRRYTQLCQTHTARSATDPEMQSLQPGRLEIGYYTPRSGTATEEPNKSHLKLTIVDEEIVVLGSGNMDRASWYTSQELGIAFFSKDLAKQVRETTMEGLQGRVKEYFP